MLRSLVDIPVAGVVFHANVTRWRPLADSWSAGTSPVYRLTLVFPHAVWKPWASTVRWTFLEQSLKGLTRPHTLPVRLWPTSIPKGRSHRPHPYPLEPNGCSVRGAGARSVGRDLIKLSRPSLARPVKSINPPPRLIKDAREVRGPWYEVA